MPTKSERLTPRQRADRKDYSSVATDDLKKELDQIALTMAGVPESDTYNREYGRLLARKAMKELTDRNTRLNPKEWNPYLGMLRLWEEDEDLRRRGGRGAYAWDQSVRSKSTEPFKVAAGKNSWKCNVAFANAMNNGEKMRVDIGKTKTTAPSARAIHRGEYTKGLTRIPESDILPGDIMTVDEGPESVSDHIVVVGPDPRGSGKIGVFGATGGVIMGPDGRYVPNPDSQGGVIWTEMNKFKEMFDTTKSFNPKEPFRFHRYKDPDLQQDAKGGEADGYIQEPGDDVNSEQPVDNAVNNGGPRIVINPSTFRNSKDALCVAFNERFRIAMEQYGFEPKSEPTPAQRRFFADTAYADDEVQLRRTILARILTLDTSISGKGHESTAPTDEQIQEALEFLQMFREREKPSNEWEASAIDRLFRLVEATVRHGKQDVADSQSR